MPSISSWYHSQYSTWNRTRRLHASPFLARTDTNTARAAAEMARFPDAQDVIVNLGDPHELGAGKDKKKQDSLFGPNIGVVSSGPAWTEGNEKKSTVDQLSPEVVKSWIAKSKEAAEPTTTLQALVNLKRPTLRLSPLSLSPTDDPTHADSHHHHGLEFEYDCDTQKCGIYVHVLLSSDHPHAEPTIEKSDLSRVLVFEAVVDGGFGKVLKLEEGATLELGRFEHRPLAMSHDPSTSATNDQGQAAQGENATAGGETTSHAGRADRRRRFTHFNFRRRSQDRSVSGPALAVVDAETGTGGVADGKDKDSKGEQADHGVKVTIRLAALDDDGKELASTNEQVTYLHVVRFGAAPAEDAEDTRPWVVKVVKREATIGPHTFHLHEIYGLSSQSSSHSQSLPPAVPPPTSPTVHTYPPTSPTPAATHEDEPSSECLLCLSSPREVVLLPCRHLVACKECAINMVEFGAGGNIVHAEPEAPPGGAAGGEAGAGAGATGDGAPAPSAPAPAPPRRKRKAKGWFCPVCRQPYTSLLRITTSPPTKEEKDAQEDSEGTADPAEPSAPAAVPLAAPRTGFVSSLRPGFLRTFSRGPSSTDPATPETTLPPDLERGEGYPTTVTTTATA